MVTHDDPERRYAAALDRVLEVAMLLNQDMASELGRIGLTPSRTHLLWELRRSGPASQRALAEAMDVSARTITGLVDGLAKTGFVTREPHPTDRRAFLVTLTPHGTDTMSAMEGDHRDFARLLFARLPDQGLDCLMAGLDEVIDRLREAGVDRVHQEDP